MRIKQWIMFLSLLSCSMLSYADTCPAPQDLFLSSGEYSWYSRYPGWEGGFYAPTTGRGKSTQVDHFMQAQWVQLTNHADSLGYVVCDYKGNYDDEVIRFTQTSIKKGRKEKQVMSLRPKSVNWDCKIMPEYPNTACTCVGVAGQCTFKTERSNG